MKKVFFLLSIIATTLLAACGSQQPPKGEEPSDAISTYKNLPGDSTLYGLACDGCTDSILIFLPNSGGDPDTFDIIRALENRKVLGRPHVGDEVAVIVNPDSASEALMVINLNTLRGQWCHMVTPTLRQSIGGQPLRPIPDSIRQRIMQPREYGIRLKTDYTAHSIGVRRSMNEEQTGPVEYPKMKRYSEWRIFNGRLILLTDTTGGLQQTCDTATIQLLHRDTLVLRFADKEQGYYRKAISEK